MTTCQRTEAGTRVYACPSPFGAYTSTDTWSGAITPHSCSTNTSGCITPSAPVVITDTNGSLSARYFTNDPPASKRILAGLSVGDTAGHTATFASPGDWAVTWDVVSESEQSGGPAISFGATVLSSGVFSVDHACGSSHSWAISATVTYLPTGTISTHGWTATCERRGI